MTATTMIAITTMGTMGTSLPDAEATALPLDALAAEEEALDAEALADEACALAADSDDGACALEAEGAACDAAGAPLAIESFFTSI